MKKKIFSIIHAIATLILCVIVIVQTGIPNKMLIRFGLKENYNNAVNYSVMSWNSCINQLNYDADVVFYGDSITRGGNFASAFPNISIVNLGLSGDTLGGMYDRSETIAALHPEKIFFMGGINNLRDTNLYNTFDRYKSLIEKIKDENPTSEIYIQSILPISKSRENPWKMNGVCKNSTIAEFNSMLNEYATSNDLIFIDLFSLYEDNGEMRKSNTIDGIHITEEAYGIWFEAIEPYIN